MGEVVELGRVSRETEKLVAQAWRLEERAQELYWRIARLELQEASASSAAQAAWVKVHASCGGRDQYVRLWRAGKVG
jgi:hypothetical protein